MASLDLAFNVLAKDNASKTFNKVGDSVDKTSGKIGKLGKAAGLLAAGGVVALGAGLVSAFRGGLEEFKGNQTALAQLEQGLKSTGGVANVTGKQVQGLADAIEAKTGTDGAQIVSGAALLATFTKVRNEVGAGNDVFARATEAGVDLAARGFGSVESNAILLGKALNDPVKGLAALGKQGVTFTAEQKKLIGSLVETGDTLGAQKIILAEVEGQVGGSAEAFGKTLPGQLARARAALDGAKETFVKALLPAISATIEFVSNRLVPAFQGLADKVGPIFKRVSDVAKQAFDILFRGDFKGGPLGEDSKFVDSLFKLREEMQALADKIRDKAIPEIKRLFGEFRDNLVPILTGVVLPAFKGLFNFIKDTAIPKLGELAAFVTKNSDFFIIFAGILGAATLAAKVFTAAQVLLNIALTANPIGVVIVLVAALVAGIVTAYQRSETFRTIVQSVFRESAQAVLKGIDLMLAALEKLFRAAGNIPGIGDKFKAAADRISDTRDKVGNLSSALDAIGKKNASPSITIAGIGAAEEAIIRLERRITNIGGTQVRIPVSVGGGRAGGVQERADGGPVRAGQPYLVGERGPELIVPPRNGFVLTADQTRAAAGAAGGGNSYTVQTNEVDPVRILSLFRRMELLNA